TYTPVANANGTATITVTVTDDATAGGAALSISQTFTVTVTAVNDAPTLAPIPNPAAILEDAGQQTVNLSGITVGPANEIGQALAVNTISRNAALIARLAVACIVANATGSLIFTPMVNGGGTVTI